MCLKMNEKEKKNKKSHTQFLIDCKITTKLDWYKIADFSSPTNNVFFRYTRKQKNEKIINTNKRIRKKRDRIKKKRIYFYIIIIIVIF